MSGQFDSSPDPVADPPIDLILRTAGGYCVSRALHVVAELGIADEIADGAMAFEALAARRNLDSDSLGRILRLLSAHGIFHADADGVSHNEASAILRSDHPQSARALARMFGLPVVWQSFGHLGHSVTTGRPAAESAFPAGFWGWLGDHPEASAIFDAAMTAKAHAQVAGVVETYDFSRLESIADVGGGRGHLLQAILARNPGARGTLFEQPHVIDGVAAIASDRLELTSGDFFRDPLPTSDAYILMEVIHDWDDVDALHILRAVFDAAAPGATVLLVEQLMPESPGPHWVKMLDAHMLVLFGAKQRTDAEYRQLLTEAGFRPTRTIETFSGAAIVESVKV